MKRIFIMITAFLLAICISTSALAHSHLGASNPADGDVVTEPLNEIRLEFDANIEQGSYIEVTTTEGQEVEIQEEIIEGDTLTAPLPKPLSDGEYQVNWNIISADGHPLEGEFSFTVDAEIPESAEEETIEPSETTEANGGEESTESAQELTENETSTISADAEEQETSKLTMILIVLVLVIVIGGFLLLRKRK
ncbi:copper resistance protein CopC [Niallia sp. XMNu-256]|uniref:copper resistance CopC family protein n=1 Tax=Niallia sp. XMNu-256 TaxID=3082444 RepID=UPI0030D59AC7